MVNSERKHKRLRCLRDFESCCKIFVMLQKLPAKAFGCSNPLQANACWADCGRNRNSLDGNERIWHFF